MIRLAKIEDLKDIMVVIEDARMQLKARGSLQWNLDNGYPDATDIINDIVTNKLFVYDDNKIKGCVVMCEADTEYDKYNVWDNNEYVALHRMAVLKESAGQGVASSLLKHCIAEANGKALRGDTHPSNEAMLALFVKRGFVNKGEIKLSYIDTFNERVLFEYNK